MKLQTISKYMPALLAFAGLLAGRAAWAQDASDTTLLLAERLLQRVVSSTKTTSIGDNSEAGQVVTALRSSRDPGLLPIFDKIRKSTATDNQIYAMVASCILAKDAGIDPETSNSDDPDLKLLFASKDIGLTGSAVASMIDAQALSIKKLKEILTTAPELAQRAMAAGELNRLHKLDDRSQLKELMKSDKPVVRYYTAMTMLDSNDAAEQTAAVDALNEMTAQNDPHQLPIQALMLVKMQKDKLKAGLPWAMAIAANEKTDEGLRYTALAAALTQNSPDAVKILDGMIKTQKDALQQVKLGLISLEYATQLNKEMLAPLAASKSSLAAKIGAMAQKAANKEDVNSDLVAVIKEGHPIVLDWGLNFADRSEPERRVIVRTAIVNQATIVDNVRDRDYLRAAEATQKLLEEDGAVGRKTVATLLASDNRAVVDATLSGIYRSGTKDQADLVLKVWDGLTKATSTEGAANYAALILAREGRKEALTWLPYMVAGGTLQGSGFRALAGWYYAKLRGKSDELIKAALAD